MQKISALEAKNQFGELLNAAQREPVTIEKHGKPVAVVVSQQDFDDFQAAKRALLKAEIQKGIDDLEAGRVVDGEEVFRKLRERIG